MPSFDKEKVTIEECESYSPEDTYEFAKKVGEKAEPSSIYCLHGDLGAGKTLFAAGFAKGIGANDYVNSPTFTVMQIYTSGRLPIYHFDVYRIRDVSEMDDIGYEEYFYDEGVCLIEWAELVESIIPEYAVHIDIKKEETKGYDYRRIVVYKNRNRSLRGF